MRIEATPWGKRIWIKNAADESSYEIRNVRPLNEWHAEPCEVFVERWEKHNRLSFNEWFHDQILELIEQIDGISEEYCIHATEDGYGWSY